MEREITLRWLNVRLMHRENYASSTTDRSISNSLRHFRQQKTKTAGCKLQGQTSRIVRRSYSPAFLFKFTSDTRGKSISRTVQRGVTTRRAVNSIPQRFPAISFFIAAKSRGQGPAFVSRWFTRASFRLVSPRPRKTPLIGISAGLRTVFSFIRKCNRGNRDAADSGTVEI